MLRSAWAAAQRLSVAGPLVQGDWFDLQEFDWRLRATGLICPSGGGALPRLDRINFVLKAGQCMAIVGASGSAKTTLLEEMAGLAPALMGVVFLDDIDLHRLTPASHAATRVLTQSALSGARRAKHPARCHGRTSAF
ncbi:MAG: ATP-binding cassette domain-containing protein [Rhodobacteraceae bacterium]|nr:ATP-binding cassette domain-containing protein [Paracoccaceae bacterium]